MQFTKPNSQFVTSLLFLKTKSPCLHKSQKQPGLSYSEVSNNNKISSKEKASLNSSTCSCIKVPTVRSYD